MIRKHYRTYLLLILLLGAALRASTLFSAELDRDEIWALKWSRQDITVELNHTLHIASIAPFTQSLPDVVGSRVVPFWAGLIVVAASARLAYRAFGGGNRARSAALSTALLTAIAPYLIAYSQGGLGYIQATAFTTLGLVFWLEKRIWYSALLWLLAVFAMSSSVLLVVAVDAATLFTYLTRRERLPISIPQWFVSHGLVYAGVLFLRQILEASPAGVYLPIINDELPLRFLWRFMGVAQCGNGEAELLPCLTLGLLLWPVLILGATVLLWRVRLYRNVLIAAVVFIPVLVSAALYAIQYGLFVHRHLLYTIPALMLLWTIIALHWRRWMLVLLTLLIAQSVLALVPYYQNNPYKPNWRQIVEYVRQHPRIADKVIAEPTLLDMLAEEAAYYFKQPVSSTLPASGNFWYIALRDDATPSQCEQITPIPIRVVKLYYCQLDNP